MPDARLQSIELKENAAGGPGVFELILTWWLISDPNNVKRVVAAVVPADDIIAEVAAYATANSLTWV